MTVTHKDWNEIAGRIQALLSQKGEPFSMGTVVRRDSRRHLVWVTGFGQTPIPMMDFNGDIYVYDEWREPGETTTVITASGTYTPPFGSIFLDVQTVAGGGGGGGSGSGSSGSSTAGGGGGGGYSRKKISAPLAASYAVTIGAGGAQGTSAGTDGTNGTDTTFGAGPDVVAQGGKGGGGVDAITAKLGGDGGGPGTGDIVAAGNPGGMGNADAGGGPGGASGMGSGAGKPGSGSGQAGRNYGGGGSGARGTSKGGGAGANGVCIVRAVIMKVVVKKKLITSTPRVPEVGDLVLIAHHLGSRELPKCIGVLQSFGFAGYDPGLE